jgi:hypothetical protein
MDWEEKYRAIEERYAGHDVRMILGIPGYMLALFDRLLRRRGAKRLCPAAELLEMYLATEAAIAFQPEPEPGLMPMVEDVFLEFVPEDRWEESNPPRYLLGQVDPGVRYVAAVTTPSGLFAYSPGDVVRFLRTDPPRFVVEGRYGNVINLAAEKLDGRQAAEALKKAGLRVAAFTVCPVPGAKPGHEWVVEFEDAVPDDASDRIDRALREMNPLYRHLRAGDLLFARPVVTAVRAGTFADALRRRAGQGKILHIYRHREVRDELLALQK